MAGDAEIDFVGLSHELEAQELDVSLDFCLHNVVCLLKMVSV